MRYEIIHEKALSVAKRFRQSEIELIEVLQEVERHRVYFHYKQNSIHQYAMKVMGLSEDVACIFINVARRAEKVPALQNEIKAGTISITKAKTISSVLTPENQAHWLDLAKSSSKHQLEREVSLASPFARDQVSYTPEQTEDHAKVMKSKEPFVELTICVSEELMLKIRQAQDLVSQIKRQHVKLPETLEAMVNEFIARHDPVEKAKRQKIRGKLSDAAAKTSVPGRVNVDGASTRQPLNANTKHRIYLKFGRRCAHTDESGNRCQERRMLEIHHIKPISHGGGNEESNLTLWCRGHHQAHHYLSG